MSLWKKLQRALQNGKLDTVKSLISAGVDIKYTDSNGYDALIYAACGCDSLGGKHLLEIFQVLIDNNVPLSGVSKYNESALRVLSRTGKFDAVKFLLDAGSDSSVLSWTPLIQATAIGSAEDVIQILKMEPSLEEVDCWSRTAWLVAILRGDLEIAKAILDAGANTDACGHCSVPPIFYAIIGDHPQMLKWLIDLGKDIEQTDSFEATAVIEAVEYNNIECLKILIAAGANIHVDNNGTALSQTTSKDVITTLLKAGADPAEISNGGIRALLDLEEVDPEKSDSILNAVTKNEHAQFRTQVFGKSNPEKMTNPFWSAMIQTGASGYEASEKFKKSKGPSGPNWSANRFGQSFTILEDGRVILIAGEHEDYYDPDFCIYNDVIVMNPDHSIDVFGYPKKVFPPTDFHTATLVKDEIYIIGNLGYPETRKCGFTPVYRLSTTDYRIEQIDSLGEMPGWIYKHKAVLSDDCQLQISGGLIIKQNGSDDYKNCDIFSLDLGTMQWHKY